MTPIWRVNVTSSGNDRILLSNADYENYQNYLDSLQGKEDLIMLIRKRPKYRSNNQNKYLWGIVYPLCANAIGWETKEIHEYFKAELLREQDGRIKSTTTLTTKEFSEYCEMIQRKMAIECGLYIPDPAEAMSDEQIKSAIDNQILQHY